MAKGTPAAFFSYSREDSEFALRLAGDLKTAGADVWIDKLDIGGGEDWPTAIEAAIRKCPRMIVIFSPSSVASNQVRAEYHFALKARKKIVPVLYRDCEVPFHLSLFQLIDFRKEYAGGLKELLKALDVQQPPDRTTPASSDVREHGHHANRAQLGDHGSAVEAQEEGKASEPPQVTTTRTTPARLFGLSDLLLIRGQLPPLKQQLKDAQSIDMSGMSLLGVATNISILLEHVKRGCKVRLLLLNPYNDNLMHMIEPFIPSHNVSKHTKAIHLSLEYLQGNQEFFTSDFVQIRLYDYPLAHAILIVDRDIPNAGRLRVEMYMRNREPADSPGFYILKDDEPGWFNTFATEFDDHWASATPYPSATIK